MKLEIGESLCYSYLRHVKHCWLVQTNWKPSEHWAARKSDAELEAMFLDMKRKFDADGKVFKQTNNAAQLTKQGEIDVIGIDLQGDVHALDVAFHEYGLNYTGGTADIVLKKLLRAYMLLHAYAPFGQNGQKFHIYFVSPKVNPSVQTPLDAIFARLQSEYPQAEWRLITNHAFADLMRDTLQKSAAVADTSELFVRAAKLLNLADTASAVNENTRSRTKITADAPAGFQGIVQALMATLLEEHPTLLDAETIDNLMDSDYCKSVLGVNIGNHALLQKIEFGALINGHPRYWTTKEYAGKYYVCKEWGARYHRANAESLHKFALAIARNNPDHPGIPALNNHIKALSDYAKS